MKGKTYAMVEFLYRVHDKVETTAEKATIAERDLRYVFERNSLLKNYQLRKVDFKANDAVIIAEFTIDTTEKVFEDHATGIENQLKLIFNRVQRLERFTIKKIEDSLMSVA